MTVPIPRVTSPATGLSIWLTMTPLGTTLHLRRGELRRDGFHGEYRALRHFPEIHISPAGEHVPTLLRMLGVTLLEMSEDLTGALDLSPE